MHLESASGSHPTVATGLPSALIYQEIADDSRSPTRAGYKFFCDLQYIILTFDSVFSRCLVGGTHWVIQRDSVLSPGSPKKRTVFAYLLKRRTVPPYGLRRKSAKSKRPGPIATCRENKGPARETPVPRREGRATLGVRFRESSAVSPRCETDRAAD